MIPELEKAPPYESRSKPWTERDKAILMKYWHTKDSRAVAKALNRSVEACRMKYGSLDAEVEKL
jgi:hypothetical protein